MTILETQRLILRRSKLADMDELCELVYADETVKSTWSGSTGTPDQIKAAFVKNHVEPEGDLGFRAVIRKDDNQLMGLMGYQQHLPGKDFWYLLTEEMPDRTISDDPSYIEVELTYAFGHRYWKQGYATEMGLALVRQGSEVYKFDRVIQGVLGHNHDSINLMRRLGFRIEKQTRGDGVVGVLDDYEQWQARYTDSFNIKS